MANEKRVRNNNVQGTLSSTMSAAGTTINSAGLANLEAISSTEHAAIIIDPGRTAGAPEIVHVTAHTGSATSATVVRGREGTAARAHSSTEDWVHAPTATIDYLPFRPPKVKVIKNTASTTADNTLTTLTWNAELFDTDNMWSSTAATLIKIRTPGTYLVGGTVRWGSAAGGSRELFVATTHGIIAGSEADVDEANAATNNASAIAALTTSDKLSIQVRQDSTGGALSLLAATTASPVNQSFYAIWMSS